MDYAQAPAIATLSLPDIHAKVIADGNAYVLWWTDHVANQWHEPHQVLGTALARLAVLQHCTATGEGFADTATDFEPSATRFLESHTTMPAARDT
ncbi:hypothetical protein [Williamsia sp.]|uniref:hypothetical protein n=1 Tax=Williamsia sp. TaxID=1872085 RepID=UPI002F929A6C